MGAAAGRMDGAGGDRNGFGGGSRRMLRRLRDAMARAATPRERLDEIVRIVAADMAAEVCSIYVRRSDRTLELCATEGLAPEAVGRTRLRVGEGLVGDIAATARPLALSDAQSHPKFAYRPETGEEIYQSLMGAPVLRSDRLLGVIAVQNRTRRQYSDEDIETLETFAMALAEPLGAGGLVEDSGGEAARRARPAPIDGLSLVPGLAIGRAFPHRRPVAPSRVVAEDPDAERERLEAAVRALNRRLDRLVDGAALPRAGEHAEVLDAYRMFARDRGWLDRMREAVGRGLTAEAAARRALDDARARIGRVSDPYLRERLADFEALADELTGLLAAGDGGNAAGDAAAARPEPPEDAVLVARALGPADLLAYDRERLRAVVLEEGSAAAHVSIVARALGIPTVGRASGVLSEVEPGDPMVVDGDNGRVFPRPGEEALAQFRRSLEARRAERALFAADRDKPCAMRDGARISLRLNAGLLADLPQLAATGAEGIGLYRTEIPFMVRPEIPDVEAQTDLYRRIVEGAGGRPVVFRALDAGGDKRLDALPVGAEDNPAMGWRSLRILLDRPALLRRQVRALIRASAGRELRLMFPMVSDVAEFDRARRAVEREMERAREAGSGLPSALRLGAMVEIPALLWQMDALLRRADFVSVGSNDLLQFVFAADRGSELVARRYDPLSAPFLRALRTIAAACARAGAPVSVCGEMAGRPLEALALAGLGYRSLSMAAASIGPVKRALMAADGGETAAFLEGLLASGEERPREALAAFARDRGIPA